jgi:hypothetical protein
MRTLLSAICLFTILPNISASAQRVSQTVPMPNRTIAAPGSRRPPSDHPESTAGTIEGFVYWDAKHFSHVPTGSCSGLAVTVAVGSSSGGPLVAYTPLATLTNNFKYVGQVKEFLAGGKVNVYDVCTYGYDQVPVGPDLQVKLTVTQPGVFSPVAVPQFAILGPIKIINGQCNMLPRITNPTVSDLFAHWGSCQNMAYDVNFVMHIAPRSPLSNGGGGTITPAGSDSQRGMLSNSPQQGMLAGAGSPTQSQSTSGGLLGNKGSTLLAGATATPASKVELNPQPLPPRTMAGVGNATMGTKAALEPQRAKILSPGCTVNQLQLRFRTGNDDLRGGQNNLNVEVHLADGTMQVAKNVNHGANWGNNSTNVVTFPLQHPVAPNQITVLRLVHLAQGGYTPPSAGQGGLMTTPAGPALAPIYAAQGLQSEDNWEMAEFQAFALGPNHTNVPIASFGMHKFTGSDPELDVNSRPDVGCSGANQVRKITLTFRTGNDDLRGGKDNLNVIIHFADGATQFEPNVNHGERWADGSAHGAEVLLNQPVPVNQIKAVTLATTFLGGPNGDNWNMDSVEITADDTHALATYGFHRFSADWSGPKAKEITIPVK